MTSLMKFNFFVIFFLAIQTPVTSQTTSVDELIFVQAVWRHGDRSPTTTFKTDPYQEAFWPQGWGQLSALGMAQHVDLGKTLRKRYIDDLNFLSAEYKNHEIYVRSTDVNRTLISAMSNLIGMYPDGDQNQVPNIPEWPRSASGKFWIPIPVHTIEDDVDYTLNPDHKCPYHDELWNLIEHSPQYLQLQHDEAAFLHYLTQHSGRSVTLSNLWIIADALFIEETNNLTLPDWATVPWNSTITVQEHIVKLNDIIEQWHNGLALFPVNGINMGFELPKIRGGTLLWSIIDHLQQKWLCHENSAAHNCSFFKKLKYYVYSAHDTTIAALFSTLGFSRTNYNQDGYPHYSSCVTIELWKNKTTGNHYVKFLYIPLVNNSLHNVIEDITDDISGGPITNIDSLAARSEMYKPMPSPQELCHISIA